MLTKYIKLITILCCQLMLTVASDASPGLILVAYNDIGLINRDNSTKVDSINLLRCLSNSNITGSAQVYVCDSGQLNIVIDEDDQDKKREIKRIAAMCYRFLGQNLSFATSYNENMIEDDVHTILLQDAILLTNINLFSNVIRNRRIGQFIMGQNSKKV